MKTITIRLMALLTAVVMLAGCNASADNQEPEETEAAVAAVATATPTETPAPTEAPAEDEDDSELKYIFLFIGDGMSYPQIQAASYYLGAVASDGGVEHQDLSFMDFPVAGSATTYDSTSFAPDSASTATSIASGEKTYSGTINYDTTFTRTFETIAEKLSDQRDFEIGIVTSVNLNHATPAAFYAHQESRNSYYDIGLELVESGFTYFAGGDLLTPTGSDDDQTHLHELAEAAGYTVATTQAEAEALSNGEKSLVIAENLADANSISYAIDAESGEWVLADYVEKGIEVLDNDTGFFMMVEGGKIDWAGHANDAATNIHDTIAMSDAVQVAIDFYNEHPEETLILVTGDHETGGMSIGYAGTSYDTYLTNLENQSISFVKYDSDYVAGYVENNTPFEEVLQDIKDLFGLVTEDDADAAADETLVLTAYEVQKLEDAYARTLTEGKSSMSEMEQRDYELYGYYEPLSVTITHLLNNKSGIGWTSYDHTGLPVPVFALGVGAELFEGYYDNTDIFHGMAQLTGVN